jgi:CheY-like chemotaxis protein
MCYPHNKGGGMKKVLIIEDDTDLREVMSTILSGKYDIREAGSREEGYKMMVDSIPDLVVLDVMMETPDSGLDMCREMKQDDRYKNIKILMVTNLDNEYQINFESDAGDPDWLPVDGYIIKPVESKIFLKKISDLIG